MWVLEGPISDRAVRVYGILSRHAGSPGESTFRGKREIAKRIGCGKRSIDAAINELVEIGAVKVEERRAHNGAQLENAYVVNALSPTQIPHEGVQADAPPPASGGTPTRASHSLENPELEPVRENPAREVESTEVVVRAGRRVWSVDRKTVSDREDEMAQDILSAWNMGTKQSLSAQSWLAKIVMRIREHPELSVDDHVYVIALNLRPENVWWKGAATPSVIYGSDSQFERAMLTAQQQPQGSDGAFAVAMRELQRTGAER